MFKPRPCFSMANVVSVQERMGVCVKVPGQNVLCTVHSKSGHGVRKPLWGGGDVGFVDIEHAKGEKAGKSDFYGDEGTGDVRMFVELAEGAEVGEDYGYAIGVFKGYIAVHAEVENGVELGFIGEFLKAENVGCWVNV